MKVSDILEMDVEIKGDTGEKPPVKLSPEMEEFKKRSLAKAKAERDWSSRSKGSRLRGRSRGTRQADQSMTQK